MAPRRVIAGFDPSPTGGNALWWAVSRAVQLNAILFVVVHRQERLFTVPRPPALVSSLPQEQLHIDVLDALLLTVGELPADLDVRVAPVTGRVLTAIGHLADRPTDVVVLAKPPHRWRPRHSVEVFVAVDPITPPTRMSRRAAQRGPLSVYNGWDAGRE